VILVQFALGAQAWEKGAMSPKRLFNLLIALTVAAGLLSTPFAAPAVAKAQHEATGSEMNATADAAQAMAGDMHAMADMPCCPDEGKANSCDSCPLMGLCSLSLSISAPSGASALAPLLTAQTAFALPDDLLIDGLGARPPDHPPRTHV
jgi:hypothetical protein